MMEEAKQDKPDLIGKLKTRADFSGFKMRGSRTTAILIGVLALIVFAYNMFFVYIRPNEFGIKVVKIGMQRGVHEEIYSSGLNFIMPFGLQQMHRLPKDIQVLEFTNYPHTAAKVTRREKAAHIQTSDGFFVDVDVSIIYRIVDPYKVFTKIGPGNLYEDNGIIPKAEPVLKATLGDLTTEEFYNSPMRVEKSDAAKMNNAMAGSGGEALVKLRIAEAIQGKRIVLLPVSEGGMNLKTTDINRLIDTMGVKALAGKQ